MMSAAVGGKGMMVLWNNQIEVKLYSRRYSLENGQTLIQLRKFTQTVFVVSKLEWHVYD